MSDTLITIHGMPILVCESDGMKVKSEQHALDLIGEAMYYDAKVIVLPRERLEADFFDLKTRLAGQIIQKFVTYRQHLVILGNISAYVDQSRALHDFVYEANRGTQVWFLSDIQELDERLKHMSTLQ